MLAKVGNPEPRTIFLKKNSINRQLYCNRLMYRSFLLILLLLGVFFCIVARFWQSTFEDFECCIFKQVRVRADVFLSLFGCLDVLSLATCFMPLIRSEGFHLGDRRITGIARAVLRRLRSRRTPQSVRYVERGKSGVLNDFDDGQIEREAKLGSNKAWWVFGLPHEAHGNI